MENYSSLNAIRKETGMLQRSTDTVGVGDGAVKIFYTENRIVEPSEVYSLSDNKRTVYTATEEGNKITLQTAPAAEVDVIVDYKWSNLTDDEVTEARSKAVSWLNRCLQGIYNPTRWGKDIPLDVQTAVAYYAAGLLLTGEHGLATDDGLPTDGRMKLKLANDMMKMIKESLKQNEGTTRISPQSSVDTPFFQEDL